VVGQECPTLLSERHKIRLSTLDFYFMLSLFEATCSASEPCAPIETRRLVSISVLPHPSAAPIDSGAMPIDPAVGRGPMAADA
jgi:hypothetical protein